jgi:hypothetical protein
VVDDEMKYSNVMVDEMQWSKFLFDVVWIKNVFIYVQEKNQRRARRERRWHGMPFTLHHCWAELEHDEKWKNNDVLEVPKISTKTSMGDAIVVDDNEA